LGQVLSTPGALEEVEKADETFESLIHRHVTGDWGNLCAEDKQENALGLAHGWRIFSAYVLSTGIKIWVITEADRSATTFLLPSEY
jgi:hypothetical protein